MLFIDTCVDVDCLSSGSKSSSFLSVGIVSILQKCEIYSLALNARVLWSCIPSGIWYEGFRHDPGSMPADYRCWSARLKMKWIPFWGINYARSRRRCMSRGDLANSISCTMYMISVRYGRCIARTSMHLYIGGLQRINGVCHKDRPQSTHTSGRLFSLSKSGTISDSVQPWVG